MNKESHIIQVLQSWFLIIICMADKGLLVSQMVIYLFVIGALESWKVQKCKV